VRTVGLALFLFLQAILHPGENGAVVALVLFPGTPLVVVKNLYQPSGVGWSMSVKQLLVLGIGHGNVLSPLDLRLGRGDMGGNYVFFFFFVFVFVFVFVFFFFFFFAIFAIFIMANMALAIFAIL